MQRLLISQLFYNLCFIQSGQFYIRNLIIYPLSLLFRQVSYFPWFLRETAWLFKMVLLNYLIDNKK